MGGICSCCEPRSTIYPPSGSSSTEPRSHSPKPPPSYTVPEVLSTEPETPPRKLLPKEGVGLSLEQRAPSRSPFAGSGLCKTNPIDLIRGYEEESVSTLEKALTPFYDKIDHLSDYVKEAKTRCHYPSEHDLTHDEAAAIYIYTKKWRKGCLYDHLQAAWESNDKEKMKPWFKFLKLFKAGYDKLPVANGEIWKGKSFHPRLGEELDSTSASFYATMDMFSRSKAIQEQSLHNNGVNKKMFIGLQDVGAKEAYDYVADGHQGILVFPGIQLGVDRKERSEDNDSVIYHLKKRFKPKKPEPKPVIQQHYVCPDRS